jgi:glyoxylase-like metal-dependent hydrolase (beta-lactamase superfamily II)
MIESGNSVYFIDGGAPMIDELLRHGRHPDEVRAVFNTHVHGDHTAGIYHFADLVDWYYKKSSVDMYIADQPYIDALKNLIKAGNPHTSLSPDRLRFHLNDPAVAYEDENIKVEFILTKHILEPYHSYSILVSEGDKRVLFSGDFSQHLERADVPSLISEEELDLFVCEMAHFKIADIAPYLEKCKTKKLLFNHVGYTESFESINALDGKYPYHVGLALDGDTIEL